MFTKSLIAAGALATALFAFQPQADAAPRVKILIGADAPVHTVHYRHRVAPRPFRARWRAHRRAHRVAPRPFRARWRAHRRAHRYGHRHPHFGLGARYWISGILAYRGFHHIRGLRYNRGYWTAYATKRGRVFRLKVSAIDGHIVHRRLIRTY